jgi:hypothetical protein
MVFLRLSLVFHDGILRLTENEILKYNFYKSVTSDGATIHGPGVDSASNRNENQELIK